MNPAVFNVPEFQNWQWEVAVDIRSALEIAFANGANEIEAVRAITEAVAKNPKVAVPVVTIQLESAFIHGPKSMVEYTGGNEKRKCELGDLLILGSYVEEGKLRWQRVCFVQAKLASTGGRSVARRYKDIKDNQLTLLRSFPEFTGVSGIFKEQPHGSKEQPYRLRNLSGMLGAYGLLTNPGEFSIISARVLDHILAGRQSLAAKELVPAFLSDLTAISTSTSHGIANRWSHDPDECAECREMFTLFHFIHTRWHRHIDHLSRFQAAHAVTPNQSVLSCMAIDAFVQSWTSLRLGEQWHPGTGNMGDEALARAVHQAVSYLQKHPDHVGDLGALKTLLEGVDPGIQPNGKTDDQGPRPKEPTGFGILSATVTRKEEEKRKR